MIIKKALVCCRRFSCARTEKNINTKNNPRFLCWIAEWFKHANATNPVVRGSNPRWSHPSVCFRGSPLSKEISRGIPLHCPIARMTVSGCWESKPASSNPNGITWIKDEKNKKKKRKKNKKNKLKISSLSRMECMHFLITVNMNSLTISQ